MSSRLQSSFRRLANGLVAGAFLVGGSPAAPAAPPNTPTPSPAPMAPAAADPAAAFAAATEFGFGIFQRNCTSCHGNPAVERAPTPDQLRQFPPERIYAALTTGPMKAVGDTLTDQQRRQVSESLAGRLLGAEAVGDASKMPNRCAVNPPMNDPASAPGWNGWGVDLANTRFQPADQARLPPESVPKLTLKWVFGLPNATSSYSQPTVVSGRVFVGADTGYVYSLDAQTGCVYWSFLSKAGVRNAMTIGEIRGRKGTRYAVYYGDLKANAYALDAQSGRLLWTTKVEDQYTDRVTASPAYYKGRLYVPISSWEEFAAGSPTYPCCTSVGNVAALDANTGKQIWKTYVIADRPKPVRTNSTGVQQWAPAGGSVWNTPTLDPKRNTLYFGTGDATTEPAAETSDSVMALNMDTGKVLWTYQVTKNDSFLGGCGGPGSTPSENCPKHQGPDWDIPAPVILRTIEGKDLLLVSTKPGDILGLDPDNNGALLWRSNVHGVLAEAPSRPQGLADYLNTSGVLWGGAASPDVAYFGLTGSGGAAALQIKTGKLLWLSNLRETGARISHGAATTAIPGVLFLGGSDGIFKAVSADNGDALWEFNTKRDFSSVNQVPTHGGSISVSGGVVVDGMVFVGSGFAVVGGTPGNALLAFGVN